MNDMTMQELSIEEAEFAGGGLGLFDWVTLIDIGISTVIGGLRGARNLADFAGEDPLLEAVRGGNLGA